jgi:RNA polymerase sigma-70 factor (ECF subfamily)
MSVRKTQLNATIPSFAHYDKYTPENCMTVGSFKYQWESHTPILDDDMDLVAEALQNTDAAGRLYDKYYDRISRYIYRCTFDRQLTEDLTANVFLAVFGNLQRFKWKQIPFHAWLYRIATNEMRSHFRRRSRVRIISLSTEDDRNNGPHVSPVVADLQPHDLLGAHEETELLKQALSALAPKYRTVIVLRYFEDKAIAEIAQITGQRTGTVKSQLSRGLARLRVLLERSGVLPK